MSKPLFGGIPVDEPAAPATSGPAPAFGGDPVEGADPFLDEANFKPGPRPDRTVLGTAGDALTMGVTRLAEGISSTPDVGRQVLNFLTQNIGAMPESVERMAVERGGIAQDVVRMMGGLREGLRIEKPQAFTDWETGTAARTEAIRAGGSAEGLPALSPATKATDARIQAAPGARGVLAAVADDPAWLIGQGGGVVGQMAAAAPAAPAGPAAFLGLMGGQAGAQNAQQIVKQIGQMDPAFFVATDDELFANAKIPIEGIQALAQLRNVINHARATVPQLADATPEQIAAYVADTQGTDAFGPSAVVNAVLPLLIPGGTAVERALGGAMPALARAPAAMMASRGGRAAVGAVGETVTEGGQAAIDQVIQNEAAFRPLDEDVAKNAVLEAMIGGPVGGIAGAASSAPPAAAAPAPTFGGEPVDAGVQPGVQSTVQQPAGTTATPGESNGQGQQEVRAEEGVPEAEGGGAPGRAGEAQGQQAGQVAPEQPIDLAPREAPVVPPSQGETREQLVEAWRRAGTAEEKARAAAAVAGFDVASGAAAAGSGVVEGRDAGDDPGQLSVVAAAAPAPEPGADGAADGDTSRWQRPATEGDAPAVVPPGAAPAGARGDAAPRSVASSPVRAAVAEVLGDANRQVNIHATPADIDPEVARRVGIDSAGNGDVEGFYDPQTGEVHIIESALDTARMPAPARAAWVAAHERAGHAGLRGLAVSQSAPGAGGRTLVAMLDRARQNPTVAAVAERIAAEHGYDSNRSAEEAIVELQAAVRTGRFEEIEQRYGVKVPPAQRSQVRAYIERLVEAIKRAFGAAGQAFSDADVRQLLEDSWRYARENEAAPTSAPRRAPADPVAQRVFHGTPSRDRIERFDLGKIGTGEGNQAYGWGMYFAGNRDVAEQYRRGLSAVGRTRGGTIADFLLQKHGSPRTALEVISRLRRGTLEQAERMLEKPTGKVWQSKEKLLEDLDGAERFIRANNSRGQLLQMEIPDDDVLLDYDAPLSAQPPAARAAIDRIMRDNPSLARSAGLGTSRGEMTGGQFYEDVRNLGVTTGSRETSELFRSLGVPGLRYADGESRGRDIGRTYNYVIWDEGSLDAEPERLIASRTSSGLLRNLTPAEKTKLTDKTAAKVVDLLKKMPPRDEMAAVAYAGRAKRGWYKQSAEAISAVFGADAPRFAGLLAAMSPQTSVEMNLQNALNTWVNWIEAGRPTAREDIIDVMARSVAGGKGRASVLPAWINNSVVALSDEDPALTILSGPKVDSFMRNLLGNVEEVTNDAWMANYAAIEQTLFAGNARKVGDRKIGMKGPGYLAMSARVREAADRLTKLTGETWSPAEVQETVWSWAKTVYELADSAGEIRTARELIQDRAITDELIAATPDFGTLFADSNYAPILEEAGYGEQIQRIRAGRDAARAAGQEPEAGGEASPFAAEAQQRLEERSAARLDAVRRARLDAERGNAAVTDAEEDIPFSRRQTVNPYGADQGFDLEGLPVRVQVYDRGYVEFHGYEPAQTIAARFAARHGNQVPRTYAQVDVRRAKRIADEFDRMEHAPQDPEVASAYRAMIDETLEQYRAMMATGLTVEFIPRDTTDPYAATPRMAILDVVENNHLWVFSSDEGFGSSDLDVSDNPLWEVTPFEISGRKAVANDIFRAVHDYFGHIANGVGFRADGEENAWREHAAMYSPLARRAMTSETRGQNSWVNYGPHGDSNRHARSEATVYADQKTGLMPEWVSEEGRGDDIVASRARNPVVDTPEFQRWFGDSKVVDENGDPLVVYHGSTERGIDVFDTSRVTQRSERGDAAGTYFTSDPAHASAFMRPKPMRGQPRAEPGQLVAAYLSLQNPLDTTASIARARKRGMSFGDAKRAALEALDRDVHDGIVFRGDRMNPPEYVAFRPEQIKSATGNSGAFDPENPSILASRGFSAKERQPDAVSVDAYHYSTTPGLRELDPTFAGSSAAGGERRRFGMGRFGNRGGTAARLAFYVREPAAPVPEPESMVAAAGTHLYRVQLDNLYDLDEDPRGFAEQWGMNQDAIEEEISDAGFDGFYAGPQPGIDTPVAVVFDLPGGVPVEPVREQLVASRRTPAQARAERQQLLGHLNASGYPQPNPAQPIPGGPISTTKAAVDHWRVKLQDKMLPLLRAQERVSPKSAPGVTSITLGDIMNAYRLENLSHGAIRDAQEGAEKKFIMPLQGRLKNIGMSVPTFEGYLLARTAEEVNKQVASVNKAMPDGGSGMTTAEARAVLSGAGPNPYTGKAMTPAELQAAANIAQLVDGMRDATLQNMVDGHQITPKLAAELKRRYPHYVPLRGKDMDEWMQGFGGGTGKGLATKKAPIKRRLGRGQGNLPQNILGEMASDLQKSIIAKGKIKPAQALLRFLLANPMPDLATVEPVDLEWKYSEATGEAYLGVKNSAEDVDRSIIVLNDGQPVRIRFEDEALRDAAMNMGPEGLQSFVRIVGAINRWRSAVLTRFNPAFTPVNILRDLQFGTIALLAEHGPAITAAAAANYLPAMKAIYVDNTRRRGDATVADAQKTMDDWAREASEVGMRTGLTQVDDVVDLQRRMSVGATTIMQLAAEGRPWAVARESVYRAGKPIVEAIENVNDASENALRLAAYVALRKRGMPKERAAEYSKNLTINFNRKGQWGSVLNAIYLFYNAAIQGTHAVARVLRNPKVATFLGGMAVLQGYLARQMMDEDDEEDGVTAWDAVPDYVKRTSLVVPLGSLTGNQRDYFALPMPYGFNLFAYTGGRVAQWDKHGKRPTDKSFIADIVKSTTEAFSPLPIADGYTSLFGDQMGFAMQLAANRDDQGFPIMATDAFDQYPVPRALKGRVDTPKGYHVAAQLLAKLGGGNLEKRIPPIGYLDVAPEQIEAVVGYVFGGLGSIGNQSVRLYEQLEAGNLERGMDVVASTPIAKRLVGSGSEGRAISERYYGERAELARKKDVLQDVLAKSDDPAAALEAEIARDPTLSGLDVARYKEKKRRGQIKRTASGEVQLEPDDESAIGLVRDADKQVKAINKAIRKIRAEETTNAEIVALVSEYLPNAADLEPLGLPAQYNGAVKAPNRVRQRAIKLLQDRRTEDMRVPLQRIHKDRSRG